jgi:hypothetical protein
MINWPENIKLKENKYSRWYSLLIEKARARKLPKETYTEGHHVIPKSWGGPDIRTNIVRLTAREHYIAHAFLWKINVSIGYHNKMMHAFNAMSIMKNGSYNKPGYKINSRLFELVRLERIAHLKTLKGPLSPNWGKKLNVSEEGKLKRKQAQEEFWNDPDRVSLRNENLRKSQQTPESIAKRKALADSRRGVKRDPAIIEKAASKKRGKKGLEIFSEQALKNIKEGAKNKVYSPEGKARQIENTRRLGQRPKSEEHKRKISESNKKVDRWWTRGENNPNFGKKKSEEERKAMSERRLGKTLSPEQLEMRRQRMSNIPKKTCEYCGKVISNIANYNRWHGDNCKHKLVDNN